MIYAITLYTRQDNINNNKMIKLLSERFLCPVNVSYSKTYFDVSAWSPSHKEEMAAQKSLDKYFNRIKKRYE